MKRKGTSQNREELIKRIQMLTGGRSIAAEWKVTLHLPAKSGTI